MNHDPDGLEARDLSRGDVRDVPERDLSDVPVRDLPLEEAALGALPANEQAAVEARAASDPALSAELNALRETVALVGLSAAPAAARGNDPVRARLLARATADAAGRSAAPVAATSAAAAPVAAAPVAAATGAAPVAATQVTATPGPLADEPARVLPLRSRTPWYVAGIATLAAAASLLLVLRARTEANALRDSVAALAVARDAAQESRDSLMTLLAERDVQLASVTGPDVAVVELASTAALPPSGRMFWDRARARWTFVANNLPALDPGRAYALWLITSSNEKIGAGTFTVDANGVAVVRAEYELARDALAAVAVTEEPAGGVPQPTGDILLVGSATITSTR